MNKWAQNAYGAYSMQKQIVCGDFQIVFRPILYGGLQKHILEDALLRPRETFWNAFKAVGGPGKAL